VHFPNKPIRIIMPYPAGVPLDIFVRVLGQSISAAVGQPILIDNKPGAAANIGTEQAARAPADGYSLLGFGINFTANVSLFKNMGYDPQKDFVPVIGLLRTSGVLIVPPDSPFKSVADIVSRAKSNPESLSYASGGNGSMAHFCGEMFKSAAGIKAQHIPYKGSPEVLNSLWSNQTQFAFPVFASSLAQIKAGKLRALAVTSTRRMPQLPDVPTMHEALGVNGFDLEADNGIVAPTGTPDAILAKLYQVFAKALAQPNISAPIVDSGYELLGTKPNEVTARVAKDIAKYRGVIQLAGIRVD
jgi:tripartite-type tricarboxylate transporter receptor subunit TctC